MRKYGISGFGTRQWLISDHDASTAYLAQGRLGSQHHAESGLFRSGPRRVRRGRRRTDARSVSRNRDGHEPPGRPWHGADVPACRHDDAAMGCPNRCRSRLSKTGRSTNARSRRSAKCRLHRGRKGRLTCSTGRLDWSSPCSTSMRSMPSRRAPPRKRPPRDAKQNGDELRVSGQVGRRHRVCQGRPCRRLSGDRYLRRRGQEPSRRRRSRHDGRIRLPSIESKDRGTSCRARSGTLEARLGYQNAPVVKKE